jgi:hypothetical protein
MTGGPAPTRTQFDVRVCAALIGGAGVIWLVESLFRLSGQPTNIIVVPIIALVLEAAAAVVVVTGNRVLRPGALVITVLGALLHMVILLGDTPIWTRIVSGILAAAQIYALVLLNTKPIREHFGLES